MKKKEKKEKKKLTKKQIVILIVVTIILGIICYFAATEITKSIIDHKTIDEKMENDDFDSLRELDTVDDITLEDLINNYNELSDDDIDYSNISDNKVNIDNIEVLFDLKDDNNVNIVSINFKNKTSKVKDIISNMIIANKQDITKETTDLIYDRVFETLGNTEDENSKTSEFFQYQGLEFSLKEYKDSDYKYSFRIGRIVDNKEEETNEE